MSGLPYRSKLLPHLNTIRSARLQRKSWREIANELRDDSGLVTSPSTIYEFFKRQENARIPLGYPKDKLDEPQKHMAIKAPKPTLQAEDMKKAEETTDTQETKLVIFTQGGKGGVGKTTLSLLLLDYYRKRHIEPYVIDFDNENTGNGGLSYYWSTARKVNMARRDGLDAMLDGIESHASIVFADLGARSGDVTFKWFDDVAEALKDVGVIFAAVGIVTDDSASVSSVIEWGNQLRNRVRHIIVLNKLNDPHAEFTYWHNSPAAKAYREQANPVIITLDSITPELQNALRIEGETVSAIAEKRAKNPELHKMKWVIRAQQIRKQIDAEFDRIMESILP